MPNIELKLTQKDRWAHVQLRDLWAPIPDPSGPSAQVANAMLHFTFWGRWRSGPNHRKSSGLSFGTSIRTETKAAQGLDSFWTYSKTTSSLYFIELPKKTRNGGMLTYSDYGTNGWETQKVVVLTLSNVNLLQKNIKGLLPMDGQAGQRGFVDKGGDVFEIGNLDWQLGMSDHKY